MLTSARETGSCQVSSFLHDADNISGCFECDSSSNMCFGCSKEPSHRNGSFEYSRQVFVVKKPSYMSFTHSYLEVWLLFFVYFLQENIAMKTADRRSSLFKILKSFLLANSDA